MVQDMLQYWKEKLVAEWKVSCNGMELIALEWKVSCNGMELVVLKETWGGNEILGQGFERRRLTFR